MLFALIRYAPGRGLNWFFGHESKYGSAIVLLSLIFLFTSSFSWKNRILFLLMLSGALFSMKGKIFGFYAFAFLFTFFYNDKFLFKLSLKNTFIGILTLGFVFWAAQDKILYYTQGFFLSSEEEEEMLHNLARPLLYLTSYHIMNDYFPFGSGFGSFATHASRVDYSSTYSEYGLDRIWGLSENYSAFVADTHFPSLAQFGWVGAALFLLFWYWMIKNANKYKLMTNNSYAYFLIILTFVFLMIECVADAAFTNNRGFMSMLLLGYFMNELRAETSVKPLAENK